MKTIVLIGKANDLTQEVGDYLRRFFRIQSSTEKTQNALGTIKVVSPDMIVINLTGFSYGDRSVFVGIQNDFPKIPVFMIGTEKELLPFASFGTGGQFESLTRPLKNSDIFSAVCSRFGMGEQNVRDEAAAVNDRRKKVLVVDDNPATLRSIKTMLESKYNVTLANSGIKAIAAMGKNKPDVLLLDYEMPICDGRQTLEMIRGDEDLRDIPVIFLTSVNDKDNIQAVIRLLPAGYLLKPAVPGKLIDAIERALDGAGT